MSSKAIPHLQSKAACFGSSHGCTAASSRLEGVSAIKASLPLGLEGSCQGSALEGPPSSLAGLVTSIPSGISGNSSGLEDALGLVDSLLVLCRLVILTSKTSGRGRKVGTWQEKKREGREEGISREEGTRKDGHGTIKARCAGEKLGHAQKRVL